jgi:hypothetical protein
MTITVEEYDTAKQATDEDIIRHIEDAICLQDN